MARNLIATVNLTAIKHNLTVAKQKSPNSKLVAVVKADAYGHGAIQVATCIEKEVDAFAVACIEEAIELREAGVKAPILLLEGFFEASELVLFFKHQLIPVIHSQMQLDILSNYCKQNHHSEKSLKVWLKVDTGMHRLGLTAEQLAVCQPKLASMVGIDPQWVLMSHFASADNLASEQTLQQLTAFSILLDKYSVGASLANSAAVLAWPDTHFDWVRPGLMLYGASPFTEPALDSEIKPAMRLTTRLIAIRKVKQGVSVGYGSSWVTQRDSIIGTLAVGYADGYPRHALSGTPVWLNGARAYVCGRVSMDMLGIDLTDHANAQVGDEVELWGEHVSVNEVATYSSTIPYTLMAGLTRRVKKVYI